MSDNLLEMRCNRKVLTKTVPIISVMPVERSHGIIYVENVLLYVRSEAVLVCLCLCNY